MNRAQSGGISFNDHAKQIGDNILGNQINNYIKLEPLPEIDLDEALARLQTLPTEVLSNTAPEQLPAWSRFQRLQQAYFVGRDTELLQIARTLKQGNTCLITTGIAGAGKSSLASEFAYRYGSYFAGGVFWLSFADTQNIANEIAECGNKLRLFHEQEDLTLGQRVERVKNEWQKPIPRLLIFDNCDQLSAKQCRSFLSEYLPTVGGCRVLITSRNSLWPTDTKLSRLALDILERAESIKLLQHYRADLSDSDAGAIADLLGDLPLALTLAGRYLADVADESYGQASVYLRNLREKMLGHASLNTDEQGERGVQAAIELSYQRLNPEQDTLAIELLQHASYFAPSQPFSKKWLQACIAGYDPNDETQGQQRKQSLNRLLELGLLEQNAENQLRIHRLIANYSQHMQPDTRAQERVEAVLVNTTHDFVNDKIPSRLSPILPHLYHCYRPIERQDTVRNANLALALGRAEHEQNNYQQAESLFDRALYVREQLLGIEHPDTAIVLNNLASMYKDQGRYEKAEPHYLRALGICETVSGLEHPDTAIMLNNLADLYRVEGKLKKAELLYQRVLEVNEKLLGAEHLTTASTLNNIALLYKAQGRYLEAESLFLRSLHIHELALENNHPIIAQLLNNLANLYGSQGRYKEAETLLVRALRIHETVVGREDPATATSLNNLALVYKNQGRYSDAKPLYERALTINKRMLGDKHPTTASSLNNLADLYEAQGRYEEAEQFCLRALHIREIVLGTDHPKTATTLNNLANLYRIQRRYNEAEPLFLRALRIRELALGNEHPDTAVSLNNLALLYIKQERYNKAEPLFLRALRIDEMMLGGTHPITAAALNNLASLYVSMERYNDAKPLFLRALSIRESELDSEHPDIAYSLNSLANLCVSQGQYDEAEPLYLRALRINETALGAEHPTTAAALNNLASLYQSQGRYDEVEPLYLRALRIYETALGAEHPDTQNARRGLEFTQHLANELAQAQAAVQQALSDPSIDRQILAQQIAAHAQYFAKDNQEGSPLYVLAKQLRALIAQLDLENYTPPSEEQQVTEQLANAQAHVERALSDSNIDRQALAQMLEQAIQQWESSEPESPWYAATNQLRGIIARLDLENYIPPSQEQEIANHLANAQAAVEEALNDPSIDRQELIQALEANVQRAAEGEEEGSPWYVFAGQLRALAAQLRDA